MANTALNLVSLDFDSIKNNLINFLSSQETFKDYNFNGSSISVLLDVLAYNTSLNAFYLNMMASEMFLDSAQLRASVVSRAKELNYTPRSYKSSKAIVNIKFPQSNLSVLEIPSGTAFTGKNANGSYTFVSNTAVFSYPSGGYFTVNNYPIYEGVTFTDTFTVDYGIEGQQFILTNTTVDTDTLTVTVLENNGANNIAYSSASSLFGVNSNSAVYFIQAIADTSYEIVFGDNVFGRTPQDGAIILVSYRTTSGTDGDGCTNFVINTNLGPINGLSTSLNYTLTTANSSYGSANSESIESIRYNAPRAYQTQERAVTANDFKTMILQNYTDVKAVNVYGGEEDTTAVSYGKVFISPVTYSGFNLSDAEQSDITTYITDRCTIGITPVVINPDYLYIITNTTVKYDSRSTTNTPIQIQALVTTAIQNFNNNNLIDFNITFYASEFDQEVTQADPSIISSQTKLLLRKDISPVFYEPTQITLKYYNALVPGSLNSTQFNSGTSTYIYTDYNPNVNSFTIQPNSDGTVSINNSKNIVYLKDIINNSYTNAGTINYQTGTIILNTVTVTAAAADNYYIQFFVEPNNFDVSTQQNSVLEIDLEAGVTVTVNPV